MRLNDVEKISDDEIAILKQYGIVLPNAFVKLIDVDHDSATLLLFNDTEKYLLAADDALYEDWVYERQALKYEITKLIPRQLLKPSLDGEYITMYDEFKVCKVYEAH